MNNDLKVYDKSLVDDFKHIPEVSFYNHNYYIGLRRNEYYNDLLFAKSDDDNTTEWYLVTQYGRRPLGYSHTSDDKEFIRFWPHELT